MSFEEYGLGATVVGIKARDGVVLAAEKRVAYGFYVLSRSGKKVFRITDNIGIAAAGVIADMQTIARILRVNSNLYQLDLKRRPPVRSVAKLLSIIMFERKLLPFIAEVIVGGVDEEPRLFVLDPLGSLIEDNYAALGTGTKLAISVLEQEYRDDVGVDRARNLAVNAVKAAMMRDPVSGDGVDVMTITRDGKVSEESITVKVV